MNLYVSLSLFFSLILFLTSSRLLSGLSGALTLCPSLQHPTIFVSAYRVLFSFSFSTQASFITFHSVLRTLPIHPNFENALHSSVYALTYWELRFVSCLISLIQYCDIYIYIFLNPKRYYNFFVIPFFVNFYRNFIFPSQYYTNVSFKQALFKRIEKIK